MSVGQWIENSPVSYAEVHWGPLTDFSIAGHYFSFFMVVGTSVAVDLRLLGLGARSRKASELAEMLFPWTWTFLGVVVLTGFLYFAPSASTFLNSSFFFLKLLLTALASVWVVLIQRNIRKWDEAAATPPLAKLMAIISLLLWIGTILVGTHVPVETCV